MDVRGLKEGAVIVVVATEAFAPAQAGDLTAVGVESADVRTAKGVAKRCVPLEVPASSGGVVAYVVRVEAVLPFRPRLALDLPDAKETTTEATGEGPVDLG
jgi:hypothetical protein